MANVLGDTMARFWGSLPTNDEYYYALTVDEWVILDRLSAATGKNFSSWAEYFDPAFIYKEDAFSATVSTSMILSNKIRLLIMASIQERYNFSSFLFDLEASGGIVVYGYSDRPATSPQPYKAEDIIIVSTSGASIFKHLTLCSLPMVSVLQPAPYSWK